MGPDERDARKGDSGRPPAPLGRGLEDVSHLFLTGAPASRPPTAAALTEGAKATGHDALRRLGSGPLPDRAPLLEFLAREVETLEAGLRVLDTGLPCDGCGEIDLLAVDAARRLAIVDVETGAADDRLLLRGLAHFDWMTRNVPILQRMYPAHAADFSLRPRVLLVAPRLSWMARCAARQITAPRIAWWTYRALAVNGGVGVVIDAERDA